jgi:hypothetical protein
MNLFYPGEKIYDDKNFAELIGNGKEVNAAGDRRLPHNGIDEQIDVHKAVLSVRHPPRIVPRPLLQRIRAVR